MKKERMKLRTYKEFYLLKFLTLYCLNNEIIHKINKIISSNKQKNYRKNSNRKYIIVIINFLHMIVKLKLKNN